MTKQYLGDAVYVDSDGCYLILTAEDGISMQETIVLEPEVWKALTLYVSTLQHPLEAITLAQPPSPMEESKS